MTFARRSRPNDGAPEGKENTERTMLGAVGRKRQGGKGIQSVLSNCRAGRVGARNIRAVDETAG